MVCEKRATRTVRWPLVTPNDLCVVISYTPIHHPPPESLPPLQHFLCSMCVFTRNISNTFYVWDLHSLAAEAGSEYIAWKDGCNPNVPNSGDSTVCPSYQPSNFEDIIFNVWCVCTTRLPSALCTLPLTPPAPQKLSQRDGQPSHRRGDMHRFKQPDARNVPPESRAHPAQPRRGGAVH